MARRSKYFSELVRESKYAHLREKGLERLKQNLQHSPLAELEPNLITAPAGTKKMSEVLNEFVAPYRATVKNTTQYRKLLDLATMAWNASFFDAQHQEELISDMIHTGMNNADALLQKELRDIITELINRKLKYFSQEQRLIVDYELQDGGTDYHLSVASTPINESVE